MAAIDIPLVLSRIRPGAKWGQAGTYPALEASWQDEDQTLPKEEELAAEWVLMEAEWAAVKYQEDRRLAYVAAGLTLDQLVVALFERDLEGRPEASDAIESMRLEIKAMYPKP